VNKNEKETIQYLEDIIVFSNELNIKSYVWGGFVQDIIEGKFLREHKDIDIFIENMDTNINSLMDKLKNKEYNCSYATNMQMLKLAKNNVRAVLNPIIYNKNVANWKHIGDQGFICFPKDWLDTEYRTFYDVKILTSGIKFEYCVRKIIKYMNPIWTNKIRDKDNVANEYYKSKLLENNIEPEQLLEKIWGYNPYWLNDGYNGYEPPVLVIGKDYK
jgi:hypothetical protein